MDTIDTYRQIIKNVLRKFVQRQYAHGEIKNESIFDRETDRYLVVSIGWQKVKRIHGCLIHIDVINDKIWIQRDGTEHDIANGLVAAGIPQNRIVLGFHAPDIRQYTEYAVA